MTKKEPDTPPGTINVAGSGKLAAIWERSRRSFYAEHFDLREKGHDRSSSA